MLKTSSQLASALLATGVDNSEVIGSNSGNNRKLAKSDFIKPIYRAEKSSFLTSNVR